MAVFKLQFNQHKIMAAIIQYVKYNGKNRKVKRRSPRLGMITLIMGHQVKDGVVTEITRTVRLENVDVDISLEPDLDRNSQAGKGTSARRSASHLINRLKNLTRVPV